MEDKKPNVELEALVKQIEFILGATKTGLDIIDPDYNIRYIDPEWKKVYGDPAGKKCYEYFMGVREPCPGCGVAKAFETKKPVVTEEILIREGNRPIQVTTIPFQDEKGQWLVAEVNVDISYHKEMEEKFKQAKERAELLYRMVPSAIFTVDKQRRVTSWNNKAAEITGYTAGEMIGKECIIFSEIPCKDKCGLFDDSVSKPAFGKECTIKRKDGQSRTITKNIDYLRDAGGNIIGGIESFEDVSERRQAEKSQRESEEKYKTLIENINIGVYRNTGDAKGRFLQANPAIARMFGYDSADEFMKVNVSDLYERPEDRQLFVKEVMKNGFIKGKELRLKKKDGRPIWGSVTAKIAYDENGGIKWLDGAIEDISERKQIEEELGRYREHLEESVKERTNELNSINERLLREVAQRKQTEDILFHTNQTLQDIINFLPDATFVIDKDRKVIAWNRAIEAMTGVKQIDMLGKGDYAYAVPFYGKTRPILIDIVQKPDKRIEEKYDFITRKENILYAGVFIPAMNQGKGVYVWCIASPLFDIKGNIIGAVESLRDITDSKRAEEQLKALNREITRTNKKLKQLSLRDSHTGLYNHRYFMEAIEIEFERARRSGQPLSTMMLDLDYFKSINDVYGHQFGDLILKQFATQLKRLVRRYDVVIRYGGEEFIIISSGTRRADALNLARRILDALNLYNFGDKKHIVKLKLSIAIASYPDDNVINGMDLMGLTDQILNRVKEAGGNRVYSSLDMKERKLLSLKESTDVKFMEGKIERLTKRANQSLVEAIFAFAKTIELKDRYTGEHGERTVQFATDIARQLNLSKYDTELIRQASMLHDLGKIGVSEKILLKKGKLTKEEFGEIKKHPQIAADILRPIQFLHPLIPLILHHHERWDGKGYPHGLKGDQIPMGACVLALADHYQALISDRPYRKAFPEKEAIKIIKKGTGTQFCPKVVSAFLKVSKKK